MSGPLCAGRVAFVTGGSRGLGRAICLALAREGAFVAFNYLKSDADADATAKLITSLFAGDAGAQAAKPPTMRTYVIASADTRTNSVVVTAMNRDAGIPFPETSPSATTTRSPTRSAS